MHGYRLIALGFLAACIVNIAAPDLASAANQYFVEGVAVKAAEKVKVTGETAALSAIEFNKGEKLSIDCKKDKTAGEFEEAGKGKGTITLEECAVFVASGATHETKVVPCTVANIPIKYKSQLAAGAGPTGSETDLAAAEPAELLAEVSLAGGTCPLAGEQPLKGSQECSNDEFAFGIEEHLLLCNGVGSSVKLSAEKATLFVDAKYKLENKKRWYSE